MWTNGKGSGKKGEFGVYNRVLPRSNLICYKIAFSCKVSNQKCASHKLVMWPFPVSFILLIQEFPGVTVLPVLGNHDWWPKNQLPDNGFEEPNDLYDRYYSMWNEWIPADQENNFKRGMRTSKLQ